MAQALINLLIALALLGGESMTGYAPRYDKGVMERVAHNRAMGSVPCMVSSAYYPLGTWLYVWGKNTRRLRSCRVTDESGPNDRRRHQRTGRIVELSYEMAIELCGRQHLNHRPEQCPVDVIHLKGE